MTNGQSTVANADCYDRRGWAGFEVRRRAGDPSTLPRPIASPARTEPVDHVGRSTPIHIFRERFVRVVLLGSMLKPEVWIGCEPSAESSRCCGIGMKETDFDRSRAQDYARAEELKDQGQRFHNFLYAELCWYLETRSILTEGSR